MFNKIKNLFSSIRFWQLLVATIILILGSYGVIDQTLAQTIAGFFGVSVTVGTIDGLSLNKKK